jgi:hypothetical protein
VKTSNVVLNRGILFTFYNPDVEGFYVEIEDVESAHDVIER